MKTAAEIRAEMAALEKELAKAEEAEAKAAQADTARRAIALLAAMRTAFKELEQLVPGSFDPETWAAAFKAQAWPRSGKYKRMADLSETEVHEAQQRGVGAVAKL